MLTREDVVAIAKLKETLIPDLRSFEVIVRADKARDETETYKKLNLFASSLYKKSPDFYVAMLGAMGMVESDMNTVTNFKVYSSRMEEKIAGHGKLSSLKVGFPLVLPNLIQLAQEYKKYLTKAEDVTLCDQVLKNLGELSLEINKLQKKLGLEIANSEEKTPNSDSSAMKPPSSPSGGV